MLWIHTPVPAGEAQELSKRAGVGPVLAELLVRAGRAQPEAAAEFLRPELSRLEDPFLVSNLVAAVDRLKAAPISRVVVTDTLPVAEDRIFDKLEVLSVANLISSAIDAVFEDSSVSEIFGGENLA